MKGIVLRGLFSCSHLATSSLPVPLDPVIKTLASVGATRSIISLMRVIAGDTPTISGILETLFLSILVSFTRLVRSVAFLNVISILLRSRGFCIKSKAPFFIQSTAESIDPCPEIMITEESTPDSFNLSSNSIPSILGILMSEKITSKFSATAFSSPSTPSAARATSWPSNSRISFKVFRIDFSSSIISSFILRCLC
ncbi:hypothetical protein SDC9_81227 [bioreactor metagenome]|uniref:Uncharacterized protein n=1 Tax=bioreactor metagenome TaxID=1076179 RepID=A0A644Z183_9ZZZZ